MVPRDLEQCAAPWFRGIDREKGTLLLSFSLAHLLSSCGGELADSIHPDGIGYQAMATHWWDAF